MYKNCFVVLHGIFFLRATQQFEGQIHSNCFVLLFSVLAACPKLGFTSSMWLTTVQLEFEWNVRCKSWLIDVLLDSMTVLIWEFGSAQGFCLLLQINCFSFHRCPTACIPGGSTCSLVFTLLSDSIQTIFSLPLHSSFMFSFDCHHVRPHHRPQTRRHLLRLHFCSPWSVTSCPPTTFHREHTVWAKVTPTCIVMQLSSSWSELQLWKLTSSCVMRKVTCRWRKAKFTD